MIRNKRHNRKKIVVIFFICTATFFILAGRLFYLMIGTSEYYSEKARELHERERPIKAARGKILDRNGVVLADNKKVCTISVIHAQIKEPEKIISFLSKELDLSEEYVRKRVEKISSMERIKSNVSKEIGDRIRKEKLDGVKVDEDYKRYYPYQDLASKVLGFTGGDNQGIIGLEVKYDQYMSGTPGKILAVTDARGVDIEEAGERREEPIPGKNLRTSLDYNIQSYAYQLAKQVMKSKDAEHVSMIVMNPQNGEIYAMVDVPEFSLNDPYSLTDEFVAVKEKKEKRLEAIWQAQTGEDNKETKQDSDHEEKKQTELLNEMWRNGCINDTYEPGSAFKVVTAAAALESGVTSLQDSFYCPGYVIAGDRRIRCHKVTGHGAENFLQGTMNSCNPVFVTVGLRIGAERFYSYLEQFGLLGKTGIDLPGEATTIMHQKENIGEVELATMSFGQSFQVTPIQLAATISSLVNGGKRITPHVAIGVETEIEAFEPFSWNTGERILSEETSETLQMMLEQVVENGGGKKAYIEGFHIGGKTATSQTLPRGTGRYIASFVGFSPADDPQVLAMVVIHTPQGTYYGGQIAAPVVKQLFENILPYLSK